VLLPSVLIWGESSDSTPGRFTHGEDPSFTLSIGGLNNVERKKILPLRELKLRLPGCPITSESLYRLRYPGPKLSTCFLIFSLWTDTVRTVVFYLEYQTKDKVQRTSFEIQLANLFYSTTYWTMLRSKIVSCLISKLIVTFYSEGDRVTQWVWRMGFEMVVPIRAGIRFFFTVSKPAPRPTQAPIKWVPEANFPRIKASGTWSWSLISTQWWSLEL
jgi:hypothetical protein